MSELMARLHPLHLDAGLLLLRLVAGGFMLPHGLGKLFGWFGGPGLKGFAAELRGFGMALPAPFPLLLALLQTLSGVAVMLGLLLPVSALMAAVFLITTVCVNLRRGWFWMHGGIEYPLMWSAVLMALALTGSGALSLDAALFAGASRAA